MMKAFPLSNMTGLNQQGMDLRDYFAAKAMQALISSKRFNQILNEDDSDADFPTLVSFMAYDMADTMMKARKEYEQDI